MRPYFRQMALRLIDWLLRVAVHHESLPGAGWSARKFLNYALKIEDIMRNGLASDLLEFSHWLNQWEGAPSINNFASK